MAEVALKSTCPCNFTLHYEVASRGNIILSGQQPANLTASHRGKRATVTFDKNIHTTDQPPSASSKHFDRFPGMTWIHCLVIHWMLIE